MIQQRLDEWTKITDEDYFNRQFKTPYRSTVKFCDWLEQLGVLNRGSQSNILDIATGKGAMLYYMKQRFPCCRFLGTDINEDLVEQGNLFFAREQMADCCLQYSDLYNMDKPAFANKFDGVVMLQTLSWLPEANTALGEIASLNPKWMALSSLFYDGLVECKTEIQEYEMLNNVNGMVNHYKSSYYNTYSLLRISQVLKDKGYTVFKYCPFEMDIDLPKPEHTHMGTYTETLATGKRLQISGPVLMNWYFIYAAKKE
jgi:ubiquinone/menaquinone biosynthesis C-methylase UbiE